jgi:menaquinone-dependent protoporphyrinogen oxidase
MNVLVSVASKHGATAEIARSIAETLALRGLKVTAQSPEEVSAVEHFDAVVLGSAVYTGHWMKSARSLASELSGRTHEQPVWLFSSGPVGDPPRPAENAVDIADLVAQIKPVEHRIFAGRIDKSALGLGERAIVSALRVPVGDYRDWNEISAWAQAIADRLVATSSSPERVVSGHSA